MTAPTLFYSRTRLVRLGLFSALLGFGTAPLAWRMTGKEGLGELREAYVFYAFGADGPRFALLVLCLLFGIAGLALLVRAAGDRAAVTIRLDGVRIFRLFGSRVIPWPYLETVSLIGTRVRKKVVYRLVVRWRRLPGESRLGHFVRRRLAFPARLLDATPEQIAAWARAAEVAHRQALLHPPRPPARPAAEAFGRRA